MRCPSCGFENAEGLKFCNECGAPLQMPCAQCGFANQPQAKFCGECGAAIPAQARASTAPPLAPRSHTPLSYTPAHLAERILQSKTALEGERKQVTVLFADLKDSTELLADRDPEEARRLLDPVLERMMDAVHRYEGTVNQVMGDGIMALFGAPIAHEDHAVRACYAALAMQEGIKHYAAEVQRSQGVALHIRVGLNSGEVVVRSIGSDLHMDYTAVGQTTHLAARMEQLAAPGSIRLTAETLRLAEGFVQVNALGPVPVKGLPALVDIFELVGATAVRRRLQASAARGLTRFVGRQPEIEALQQALAWAGAGQGQVVTLLGEPGVGKSRLVYEFLHAHRTQGWLILESGSVSYGKATAYLPVCDLLKTYCHIEDHDDLRTVRAKVTGQILTLDEALQDTVPPLLALLEALSVDSPFLSLDPLQRRRRTLEALKSILLRESQVQPLLLVFEDLHWIDTETQAVLDLLVDSLPTARVLLLVNYRPEYQHGWGSKTSYTQLRLDPLPPASAEAVLDALLGPDPSLAPLKRVLIARTEGNPFFLEESVRTLVEIGVLVGESGTYRLAQALPTIQVPATVQALLAARIDRLPPEDKRLLQTAAVIGTEVPWPLLQAIADTSEDALYRSLGQLQAAEFLYETSLFPQHVYTFKHALTHEVAYGSLLLERRRRLHVRLVKALEALAPERVAEQVERLAYHALRGEVWDKAVTYCQQAGARAFDRAAFREAVASFEQALLALDNLREPGDTRVLALELRLALGGPLIALGEHRRCLALLGEAEALARALDDGARLGRVLARMVRALRITGDLDGAIAAGRQALVLAAELGDRTLQRQAFLELGQAYFAIGDFSRAAGLLQRNLEAAHRESGTQSAAWRIQSQAWLARTLSALGEFAAGRRHGEEALRLATLEGRGATPVIAHNSLGDLYLAQGDLEHAIRVFEQGLALSRASGNRNILRPIAGGLGYAYALQGRLAEGRALLEEAISEGIRMGALQGLACRVAWFSEVYRLAGRGDEAWQHARQAFDLALAEEHGMRPLMAHCHLGLGTLYAKSGQPERARTELVAAIELYRGMDMTFWLPEGEATLAQVEGR